ncbi:helix-turn-helix transcriptional regulator [Microvirga arabica]|uniref:Transcriptional regulator n=1 Tax=Microvirga arabica TaxID=1128671 RepID=A0ABV6YFJ3_9HYPH|nr:PAS domain-containing protein [Microvirga arabica]MBM1170430.1 PAS domain-containing protein [Microvirga arabica]
MTQAQKASPKKGLAPELAAYAPVCDAIALLFQPYAEVVLHDLSTETVVYLSNPFSKRELGEPSLLHEIDFKPSDVIIGPYEKVNWDGRRIKSVSAVLRAGRKSIGILCINVDVSHFHAVMQTLTALVAVPQSAEKPASLFKEDWHERINEYIQSWTRERGLSIAEMTRLQKQQLVADLAGDGAFGGRNAAAYISRVLGLGRATVYNYLRRKDQA